MFNLHLHEDKLRCPYKGCGKMFDKPSMLTDSFSIPRQTFYACPHCMSKLDVTVKDLKVTGIKTAEYPTVLDSPAKCARYSGFLDSVSNDVPLPDECLICPKVLQCTSRKR